MQRLYTMESMSNFSDLTYSDDGLILRYKNRPDLEINFSEVEQIYIKRCTLHPILEVACIALPFVLIYMVAQYSDFDILTIVAFFTVPPVLISVINYKWYRFIVRLKDGTLYTKKIATLAKTEQASLLEKVCSKVLYYKASGLV